VTKRKKLKKLKKLKKNNNASVPNRAHGITSRDTHQFSVMKLSIHGHCKQHPYVRVKISRIKQLGISIGDTGDLQKKGFQKRLQLQLLQVQGYTAYYQPRPENRVEERTLGSVTRSGLSSAVKRLQAMKEYLPLG